MAGLGRLLVTGGSGFLGRRLCASAVAQGWEVTGAWCSHPADPPDGAGWERLDLKDPRSVDGLLRKVGPQVVIHTAYSQGEREVTLGGTQRLVESCLELSEAPYFIQVSTDLVFDGLKGGYNEEDEARPVLDYGRDKLEAERVVRSGLPGSLVVRTSLMYDLERPPQHLDFAIRALAENLEFFFFRDEYRSPVLAAELAGAILALALRRERGRLNVAGAERVDRWWFGCHLMKALGLSRKLARPASFRERGLVRPADCSLDSSRAERILGRRFRGACQVLGHLELDGED